MLSAASISTYNTAPVFLFFYVGIGALGLNLHAQGIKFTGRNPGTKISISSKHGGKYGSCLYNECYNERMLELATSPPQYHMRICRVIVCERFCGRRKRFTPRRRISSAMYSIKRWRQVNMDQP